MYRKALEMSRCVIGVLCLAECAIIIRTVSLCSVGKYVLCCFGA